MNIKVGGTIRYRGWKPDVTSIVVTKINDVHVWYDMTEACEKDHWYNGMRVEDACYSINNPEDWIVVSTSNLKCRSGYGYRR